MRGLLFILFFGGTCAQAHWSADAVKSVSDFRPGHDDQEFSDAYETSLWASLKARQMSLQSEPETRIKSPLFPKASIPILMHLQDHPAPLMIIVPGIFSPGISGGSRQTFFDFVDLGFHVIILPNPWSENFIRGGSGVKPGNFIEEANLIYDFVDELKNMIPAEKILRTELMGMSYGGFIAAIMAERDSRAAEPLFDGEVTIFSPPLKLDDSLKRLDQLASEIDKSKPSLNFLEKMLLVTDLMYARHGSPPGSPELTVSSVFVIQVGFKEGLRNALKVLDETYGLHWTPAFINATTFRSYFDTYATDVRRLARSPTLNLDYWTQRISKKNDRFRILTTENDFINPRESMNSLHLDPEHILTLPSGGHLGYFGFNWFKMFRKKIF